MAILLPVNLGPGLWSLAAFCRPMSHVRFLLLFFYYNIPVYTPFTHMPQISLGEYHHESA
jgi:hypothetical protein